MTRLSALLGALVLAAVLSAPSAAMAHAELASSDPADGSTIETMPQQVTLTLSEPVQAPAGVAVTSADGTRFNSYDVTVRDDTVTTAINLVAPAGTYTIDYEIVSADDHTVTGTTTFTVLTGQTPTPEPTATATQPDAAGPDTRLTDDSAAGRPQITPATDDSSTAQDALIVIGFSIVAMTGLIFLIRAGLRSAGSEDDD